MEIKGTCYVGYRMHILFDPIKSESIMLDVKQVACQGNNIKLS